MNRDISILIDQVTSRHPRANKRGSVEDPPVRSPVLGSRNSAVPIYHAGIPLPPVALSAIDHGWLAYTDPTLPASIYADTSLAGYFAGSGTSIPGGSETDHLIGPMLSDAGRACQVGHDGIDWTTLPTLDGDAKFNSFAWVSTAPANTYAVPHRHSGLGVAFAQALLGAGRKFADILPSGWGYDPTTISLVRGPDRAYWLTKTDSAGCFLTKLDLPEAYYCLDYWLANDLLTGYSADLCLAIVLGNLTLPESPTIYEALSSVGIAGVYANSAIDLPMWGWQWSEQRAGASDELAAKAILVTIYPTGSGSTFRNNSRTCTLTLNWDGNGDPLSATLDIEASGAWRLNSNHARIYRLDTSYSPAVMVRWDPSSSSSYNVDVPGPLAAWFDSDAAPVSVDWGGSEYFAAGGDGYPDTNQSVTGPGGWSVDQVVSHAAGPVVKADVLGEHHELQFFGNFLRWAASFTAVAGTPVWSYVYSGGTFGECVAPTPPPEDPYYNSVVPAGPTTNFWQRTQNYATPTGGFIFAFGPPRSVWFRKYMVAASGSDYGNTYVLPGDRYPQLLQTHELCGTLLNTVTPSNYSASWTSAGDDWWITYDATTPVEAEAVVVLGATGIAIDPALTWWATLWALTVGGSTVQVADAVVSRGGLAAYIDAPGASPTWEMPPGLSLSAPSGTVKGWVGGV